MTTTRTAVADTGPGHGHVQAGCEPVFCEQEPGDVLFFHCNTVHQSFPNSSLDEPRWCLLTAFDSVQNAQWCVRVRGAHPAVCLDRNMVPPEDGASESGAVLCSTDGGRYQRKEDCGPTPVLADECVLEWGAIHAEAVRESGGDLKKTKRILQSRHGGAAAVQAKMVRGRGVQAPQAAASRL